MLKIKDDVDLKELENILTEREQDKARIKELEEENGTLKRVNNIIKNIDIENATQKIDDYYNEFMRNFIPKQKIKEIVDECIPKKANIITNEIEYTPNANANSYLTQQILELLQESEEK